MLSDDGISLLLHDIKGNVMHVLRRHTIHIEADSCFQGCHMLPCCLIMCFSLLLVILSACAVPLAYAEEDASNLSQTMNHVATLCGVPPTWSLDSTRYLACARKAYLAQDFNLALEGYNAALRINPDDGAIYLWRGHVYLAQHDYDHAITSYSQAIDHDLNYPWVYAARAHAFACKGELHHADNDYDRALTHKAWLFASEGMNAMLRGSFRQGFDDLMLAWNEYQAIGLRHQNLRMLRMFAPSPPS